MSRSSLVSYAALCGEGTALTSGGTAANREHRHNRSIGIIVLIPSSDNDNNTAERMIRGPVVTRKNAGGPRNKDFAHRAATIWTVTATIQMAGLNILTWLTAYLDECGRNGGSPHRARPWNGSCPGPPAPKTFAPGHSRHRPAEPAHDHGPQRGGLAKGHAGYWRARSQDFRILTTGHVDVVLARL